MNCGEKLSPGKLLLITKATCIGNTLPVCFSLSLRKATYLYLQFSTYTFHFQKSIMLSYEWKRKIPALVKSCDLFEDNVPVLIQEKMFKFCFYFTHLRTIQISANSTFSIMILKLLKSLFSSWSFYAFLYFQRWTEVLWSLLINATKNQFWNLLA